MQYAVMVRIERTHGYEQHHVHVWACDVEPIERDIERCDARSEEAPIDEGACKARADRMRGHLADGYTHQAHSQLFGERLSLDVRYQRYDATTFCSPEINVGREPNTIAVGAKLVARLARRKGGFPRSPSELLACFPKAVRVELVGWDYLVEREAAQATG